MRTILVAGPPLAPKATEFAEARGVRIQAMEPYADPRRIAELAAAIRADALIVRMGRIPEDVIAASPALRVIVKHGTGYDTIDVEAAGRRGIPVLVTRGTNAQSVAELALALTFSAARSTSYLDARVRSGHWDKADATGVELMGKALGLVGFGTIARLLTAMVAPLRMTVRAYDPFLAADHAAPGVTIVNDLHGLLRESDIVSLHCPLTPATRRIIGAQELELIGAQGILINTARGALIDEPALIEALNEGRLGAAALDCFETEPPPKDSPLWQARNLTVTPHVGANTWESRERVGMRAVQLALEVLDGGIPDRGSVVNADALAGALVESPSSRSERS